MTAIILHFVGKLAHAEAGMSDSPIPGSPLAEALVPWFAILYFAVSMVGILVARKRDSLLIMAVLAHLMLFITLCLLCSEDSEANTGNFIADCFSLGLIIAVYFSPWFVLWGVILAKAEHRAIQPQIQPFPICDRPSEKYANQIKSKY
jgi:hypothetical protein